MQVLRSNMLLMETQIGALEQLSQQCEEAVAQGQADDEAFEDTPEDFLDPLMDTLMQVCLSSPLRPFQTHHEIWKDCRSAS